MDRLTGRQDQKGILPGVQGSNIWGLGFLRISSQKRRDSEQRQSKPNLGILSEWSKGRRVTKYETKGRNTIVVQELAKKGFWCLWEVVWLLSTTYLWSVLASVCVSRRFWGNCSIWGFSPSVIF